MVLLVLDTQKGCFNENLYLFENVKNNIKQLISVARKNNNEEIPFRGERDLFQFRID